MRSSTVLTRWLCGAFGPGNAFPAWEQALAALHKPQCRLCGRGGELTPSPTAARACERGAQRLSQMGSFQMGQICLGKAERGEKGVKVNHSPGRLEVEPV